MAILGTKRHVAFCKRPVNWHPVLCLKVVFCLCGDKQKAKNAWNQVPIFQRGKTEFSEEE